MGYLGDFIVLVALSTGNGVSIRSVEGVEGKTLRMLVGILRIALAIEKLTPEQRRALILRYWEDQSLAEIAQALGKSQDAVAGLLYRAMKVMRSELV